MICANCGANNPQESAFCGGCGSRLGPAPGPVDASLPSNQGPAIASSAAPGSGSDDSPTLRAAPEPAGGGIQQPTPGGGAQFGAPASQMAGGSLPAPGWSSGAAYPAPTPATPPQGWSSGAAYPAPPAPGWSSGSYPAQAPAPPPQGWPSGAAYPVPPAQGLPGGAYPPTVGSGTEFPAGVYPTPGAAFGSGAYPPVAPAPGVQASGVYPGQQSQPGWPGYPGQVPPPVAKGPSGLIKPLPLWAFITSILVVALLLAVLVFFTGADWSAGAQTAGIVALVIGALILIAFGVRAALGMLAQTNVHRRSQIISSILLALLLFAVGAIGLTQGLGIHAVQAHFLEGQQKWQLAINEYQASGQSAPTSDDIARTYVEWGEQLANQQPPSDRQYNDALGKFNTVITTYTQASTQVARAEKDVISTSQAAAAFDSQSKNYAGATQYYDSLLGQSYCTASCQSQTGALDATAYYNLAEQDLAAQKYADAAAAFNTLTTKFGSSPEAQKAHADYAKALWGEGQAQLTTTCSSALTIYQQLATNFSDTPEGQQAATALKGPVQVKGHFTTTVPPASREPVVILGNGPLLTPNTTANQFAALFASSPHTSINSDGTFSFSSVLPGSYQLIWGTLSNPDQFIRVAFQPSDTTIGQLCPYNFGDIDQAIPAS